MREVAIITDSGKLYSSQCNVVAEQHTTVLKKMSVHSHAYRQRSLCLTKNYAIKVYGEVDV
jgi:hypothetical protein